MVDAAQPAAPRPRRAVRPLVVLGLGVVATVAGWWLVRTHPTTFGWFAYAPLAETVYAPGRPWQAHAGQVLVVVGIVLVSAAGGYLLGRRAR